MPITIIADKADELPEPLRATAKEENGKHVVGSLPDGWGVDHVAQSRSKLTKAEQDAKRASERMKAFAKDEKGTIYEPEEFSALLNEHKALKEAQGKAPDIDKLRRQFADEADGRWTKKFDAEKSRSDTLDRELDNMLLDSTINNLVAQLRPREGKADLVRLLLREKFGLDKADGKRQVRVRDASGKDWMLGNGDDGFMPAKDYALNNLRTTYADLFDGDGQGGAGANSSGSGGTRRAKYTFKRADLESNPLAYTSMVKKAKAEGLSVDLVD